MGQRRRNGNLPKGLLIDRSPVEAFWMLATIRAAPCQRLPPCRVHTTWSGSTGAAAGEAVGSFSGWGMAEWGYDDGVEEQEVAVQ